MLKLELDYRESCLIDILKNKPELKNIVEVKNLDIGDIIITNKSHKLIIERKTINDLVSSVKDGRYREQKMRLLSYQKKNINTRIIYLVEGYELSTYLKNEQGALHGSLISMSLRDNIPIFRTKDVASSILLILRLYSRLLKNPSELFLKVSRPEPEIKSITIGIKSDTDESVVVHRLEDNVNDNVKQIEIASKKTDITNNLSKCYLDNIKIKKKDNITSDNWFSLALANIPGVSVKIAKSITSKYNKIQDLINAYNKLDEEKDREKLLCELKIIDANRKIGKVISKKIYDFLIK